jgi:hypothetical protein
MIPQDFILYIILIWMCVLKEFFNIDGFQGFCFPVVVAVVTAAAGTVVAIFVVVVVTVAVVMVVVTFVVVMVVVVVVCVVRYHVVSVVAGTIPKDVFVRFHVY